RMDMDGSGGLAGIFGLGVGIEQRVLDEQRFGAELAVGTQTVDADRIFPLQRNETVSRAAIQMARSEAMAIALRRQRLEVGKLTVLEREDLDGAGILGAAGARIVAA